MSVNVELLQFTFNDTPLHLQLVEEQLQRFLMLCLR